MMSKREGLKPTPVSKVIAYVALCIITIFMVVPFLWMISSSLMSSGEMFLFPPKIFPEIPQWGNYKETVNSMPFFKFIFNSFKIGILSTAGSLLSCVIAAYVFARMKFPGKNFIFSVLLGTMMLPGAVTMIPTYLVFRELHWTNTHLPLIIPSFFGGAYGIFMLRQFIKSLPVELEEAAFIDGAGRARIIFQMIIPNTKPALATLGVFGFMSSWNNVLGPLIYLNDYDNMTLPVGLSSFIAQYQVYSRYDLLLAGGVISIIPVLFLYVFAQKYFVQGIVMSGIKG